MCNLANIIATTHEGKVITDPTQIKVERNEKTELLYRLLENFEPNEETGR